MLHEQGRQRRTSLMQKVPLRVYLLKLRPLCAERAFSTGSASEECTSRTPINTLNKWSEGVSAVL